MAKPKKVLPPPPPAPASAPPVEFEEDVDEITVSGYPIISEPMMMECLGMPPSPETAGEIQQGCFLAAIDAFDRRLKRPEFIKLLVKAFSVYAQVGRLTMITAIAEMHMNGKFDDKVINESIEQLVKNTLVKKRDLYKMADLMAQCPTSDDKVN